jgi:hypothetical protein
MTKIKSISLNSNRLNSDSAKVLANALSTCETLENLNLEENEFSTQDKQAVRRVLAKNCRVNI